MSETVPGDAAQRQAPGSVPPPQQLHLPLPGAAEPQASSTRIGKADRVFVNRHLNLANVEWLGFDMDYTLAIYQQQALDELSVRLTVERLLREGYPAYLRRLRYDTRFPIRGLLVDKRFGNVLKMDRFKGVHKGYHGLTEIERHELHELYHQHQVRPHTPRYHWIDTLFSLSEVTAYAAIVDALEKHESHLDYAKIFQQVRSCIDAAHREGEFYGNVTRDLERFVVRDPALEATLHKFRSAGKRLFLLTNSPWSYTDTMMTHLLGSGHSEYPSWRHYFDVVVVAAQKPSWFREGRGFLEHTDSGVQPARTLERGRIYEGGNLREFERALGIRGSTVLYVGDHIYGDILRSKKESTWRTAMIIQELDGELAAQRACASKLSRLTELEAVRDRLEDELRYYQALHRHYLKGGNEAGGETVRTKRAVDGIRRELRDLDTRHQQLAATVDATYHPYWGSLLKEAGELSSFGMQVETYADVYMRRVSSLRHYSPLQHYRSPRDLMPHEL